MYAERSTIQYVDLTNNNHSTQIRGLRGAVAVAYDMKDDYIYWADIKDQAIMRRKFNGSATGKIFEIFVQK
jgi:predicted chitinase